MQNHKIVLLNHCGSHHTDRQEIGEEVQVQCSLRSRDNVQAKCTELVVIRAWWEELSTRTWSKVWLLCERSKHMACYERERQE